MKSFLLTLAILISFLVASSQQLKLEISGNVNFDNSLFTINEAGLDFPSVLETQSSIYLTVYQDDYFTKKNNPNSKWRIAIFKQDNWSDDLKMEVKRSGSGNNLGNNGHPNIHGGENYQVVRNTEDQFIEGKGEIGDIPVSLKLSGFSITMGAGSHNTKILFTVYEGW
ncbi:hypothetical protein [uncultured Draconibacterium sp.]|uniref:hypothetical protein n=1 Tax=uncultured Draconibacterium sp. TaxID=1573823 RepID=UPI0032170685